MINVHGLRRNVKNVVKNYSDAQIKVREATSNDPWGPSGTLMSEIADLTYNVVAFTEVMQVLWKRLNDHGKNWKHVYKALVLLEYLLKSGSERVAHQCKENVFAIETLKDFQHLEDNKDQGVNVREKAKHLVSLLKDEERLRNERARALKARERFAQASARTHSEFIEREFNPKLLDRHSSFDEDILSSGEIFVSDLERVRPQTMGEEELQLQLALAMSKEEADQEERIKRNDELRLQMALSESRDAYEQSQIAALQEKNKHSAMEDLLDVFAQQEKQKSQLVDPWGVPVVPSNDSPYSTAGTHDADCFEEPEKNLNITPNGHISSATSTDSSNGVLQSFPENSPDLISSLIPKSCYGFSNMKKSISADADIKFLSEEGNFMPKKFLGDNANLVNLDALVENAPPATSVAANPFSCQSGNPFNVSRPVRPSINEIRLHNSAFSTSVTLPRFHSPQLHLPRTDATNQDSSSATFMNPFI